MRLSNLPPGVTDAMIEEQAGGDECEHDWKWIKDWYGDPNVTNGIADCSHWECRKCGSTKCDDPPDDGRDLDDPDELDAWAREIANE